MSLTSYTVARRHDGDKEYRPGDTREARPTDVAHLVRMGVLVEPEAKAETSKAPAKKAPAKKAPAKKAPEKPATDSNPSSGD